MKKLEEENILICCEKFDLKALSIHKSTVLHAAFIIVSSGGTGVYLLICTVINNGFLYLAGCCSWLSYTVLAVAVQKIAASTDTNYSFSLWSLR